MSAWPTIPAKGLTLPELQAHIDKMKFDKWRPNGMVVHNTGIPSLKQWHQVDGPTRIKNLTNYFRNQRGWTSGPHAFVADDFVWLFTPFNMPGTHSPSWNGTKLGIEMVADFATEDDESGGGLKVKLNTVALFGMLHRKLGIDPETIKLHKEDTRTTHDCPGKNFKKDEFVSLVKEWINHGGDLEVSGDSVPPKKLAITVTPGDTLNMRALPSASGKLITTIKDGSTITVLGEEKNRDTKWLRVEVDGIEGWVSARYTKEVII